MIECHLLTMNRINEILDGETLEALTRWMPDGYLPAPTVSFLYRTLDVVALTIGNAFAHVCHIQVQGACLRCARQECFACPVIEFQAPVLILPSKCEGTDAIQRGTVLLYKGGPTPSLCAPQHEILVRYRASLS